MSDDDEDSREIIPPLTGSEIPVPKYLWNEDEEDDENSPPPLDPGIKASDGKGAWYPSSPADPWALDVPQPGHWATKIFDSRHPRTPLLLPGEMNQCFGRAVSSLLQQLTTEDFIEVVQLPLDGAEFYVRLYWRPVDHRARILCTRKDDAAVTTHYCLPLTALKLSRKGSTLILWRLDQENKEFNVWAYLGFQFYEPLVLFYSTFAAMKVQDHAGFPEILQDKYQTNKKGGEEREEFAGEIKEDGYSHALRIWRDKDSNCIRLEARPRRGKFTQTPIWLAFVTKVMLQKSWIHVINVKTLELAGLHPYVFVPNYSPPTSENANIKLQFTSSTGKSFVLSAFQSLALTASLDASNFIEVINMLANAPKDLHEFGDNTLIVSY
jgi:hypothetical protein